MKNIGKLSGSRAILLTGAAIALCSTLVVAQDRPESLLPPGFDDPAPAPSPAPTQRTPQRPAQAPGGNTGGNTESGTRPSVSVSRPSSSGSASSPSSSAGSSYAGGASGAGMALPGNLPSISDLENMDAGQLDELLGLKPKYDIPPAARRSMEWVGLLAPAEGGLPSLALANQPDSIVRASLSGIDRPLVSRWGHILLRRALVSRLTAPAGMDPVEFSALRVRALNQLGEHSAARSLAQDVDGNNWNLALTNAALDAYIGTSDIIGACPITQLKGQEFTGTRWELVRDICFAFSGQSARAQANLKKAFRSSEDAEKIDVLLAQRFAGAGGGNRRRAVNLEWDGVDKLTPWRFSLANAVSAEIPEELLKEAGPYYQNIAATAPMLPLAQRVQGAAVAARRGVMSSSAMIDLYSQAYAENSEDSPAHSIAVRLRTAYVANDPAERLKALKDIWGENADDYSRLVLTAYAAARVTPSEDLAESAPDIIASMLTAGLDNDAMTWAPVVPQGSEAWALLVLAQPERRDLVTSGQFDDFASDDSSSGQQKSKFLLAGLAGLGRVSADDAAGIADDLDVDLTRKTKWSHLISRAAEVNNKVLVSYLAGVGMQGSNWKQMTPRHLYHIVSALNRVGLTAEARMIAAEAVARG